MDRMSFTPYIRDEPSAPYFLINILDSSPASFFKAGKEEKCVQNTKGQVANEVDVCKVRRRSFSDINISRICLRTPISSAVSKKF